MKTPIRTAVLFAWATASMHAGDLTLPGVAPKELIFKAVLCKADCGRRGLTFKALILNNTGAVVSLEKFALKTRLTLSYHPARPKKGSPSKKETSGNYKTLSILPGGAYSADSLHLQPGEIYGLTQKLSLDSTQLDACKAESIKVYGNIPIAYENQELEIAVNQDLKNNCDL